MPPDVARWSRYGKGPVPARYERGVRTPPPATARQRGGLAGIAGRCAVVPVCRDAGGNSGRHRNHREQDPDKAAEIEAWLERVAGAYNILPMNAAAFRAWARLMHRKSDTFYEDAMIAATAQVNGLTVATRNVAGFKALGVEAVDPFSP